MTKFERETRRQESALKVADERFRKVLIAESVKRLVNQLPDIKHEGEGI